MLLHRYVCFTYSGGTLATPVCKGAIPKQIHCKHGVEKALLHNCMCFTYSGGTLATPVCKGAIPKQIHCKKGIENLCFTNVCVLLTPVALRHHISSLSRFWLAVRILDDKKRCLATAYQGPPLTTSAPLGDRTVHDPTTLRDVCVLPRITK